MRAVLTALLVATLAPVGVAFAAGLTVTPQRLTIVEMPTTVPSGSTCTLTATSDTAAAQASPGNNFGTSATLDLISSSGIVGNARAFVGFNVASCSIPASATVTTARLELYMSTAPGSSRTYELHRVTQSWGETTLTWSNQPTAAAGATGSTASGTGSNVLKTWDVLADVRNIVNATNPNYGWRLKDQAENSATMMTASFTSREGATVANRPKLVIDYTP